MKASGEGPGGPTRNLVSARAPAGIRVTPFDRGTFPVGRDSRDDPELRGDQEPEGTGALRNKELAVAVSKFEEYEEVHCVKAFTAYADVVQYLDGEQPALSDVRVITKVRMGHTKHRIILDCKRAGLTRSSQRAERTTHPRVTDAVNVIIELSAAKTLGGPPPFGN